MQTLELEQPTTETTEKLLIFEHDTEIAKNRGEIEARLNLLNRILAHGLTSDQIKEITASSVSIDDFIFREQLKINVELRKQFKAGKKNLQNEYALPKDLESLKYSLLAWHSYPAPGGRLGDKFKFLVFIDSWQIDEHALENYLIRSGYKYYIQGEDIQEYNELLSICDYLEKHRCPNHQIAQSSFFYNRLEIVSTYKFIPRWQYFKNKEQQS